MILLLQYTLIFTSVLMLVALGGCFSEHSGVINIGLEGIMVFGALGGALVMKYMPANTVPILMICVTVLAAVLSVAQSWKSPVESFLNNTNIFLKQLNIRIIFEQQLPLFS